MHENAPDRGGNKEMVRIEDAQVILSDYLSLQDYPVIRTSLKRLAKQSATERCFDNREFWDGHGTSRKANRFCFRPST